MQEYWNRGIRACSSLACRILKIFGYSLSDNTRLILEQFIGFCFVGCSNVLVTLVIYYLIVLPFGNEAYMVAQAVGYVAGILNSYFWNRRFVFSNSQQTAGSSFVKTCLCYILTYFIQAGLLFLLVQKCGMSALIAPIIAIIVTIPINFILNKLWAFR